MALMRAAIINSLATYSVKSMISKPLVHKMAILAFRKIRSNDSDGRKKSFSRCWYGLGN